MKKLIILLFTVLLLVVSCGKDTLFGTISPDGSKIAFVYIDRFSKQNTHLSIIPEGKSLPRKGNVAIAKGVVPIKVRWEGNNNIKVEIRKQENFKIVSRNIYNTIITITLIE